MEQTTQIRCAIYTRKAVGDEYRKEITSCEAQRINCEKYIESQSCKGWKVLPKVYEDYEKSGANMNRAGFQELIADIQSGKIDNVVVYKLDCLTRSLQGFVDIIDNEFRKHNVSFVSVTESFDTSTPSGKIVLNILPIFTEFETE
jgi:DNA invertase Pin-like site-specific DNA recombinase